MAKWGSTWGLGFLWGNPEGPGPDKYCDIADGRVLAQMDDTPTTRNFRDLICELVKQMGTFEDVAIDVSEGFDVDVAQGVQLDSIGEVVGLKRQGFGDNDYRRFLNIQIDLLLGGARDESNWTGTHENILSITRTFIGTGVPDPIILINFPPYAFLLTIPNITLAEMDILTTFICKAIYAGVLGQVIVLLASDSLWNSDSVAVTDGGVWGSASVAVVPSATWNLAVTIGDQPC